MGDCTLKLLDSTLLFFIRRITAKGNSAGLYTCLTVVHTYMYNCNMYLCQNTACMTVHTKDYCVCVLSHILHCLNLYQPVVHHPCPHSMLWMESVSVTLLDYDSVFTKSLFHSTSCTSELIAKLLTRLLLYLLA